MTPSLVVLLLPILLLECELFAEKQCGIRTRCGVSSWCRWNGTLCQCEDPCATLNEVKLCEERDTCYWDITSDGCRSGGPERSKKCSEYTHNDFTHFNQLHPSGHIQCPEDTKSYCEWVPELQKAECIGSCYYLTTPSDCIESLCPEDVSQRCYWKAKDKSTGRCDCSRPDVSCNDLETADACDNSYCPGIPNWANKLTSKCFWNLLTRTCSCRYGEITPTTCAGVYLTFGVCSSDGHPAVEHFCTSGCGLSAGGECGCNDDNGTDDTATDFVLISTEARVTRMVTELSPIGTLLAVDPIGIVSLTSSPGTISFVGTAKLEAIDIVKSLAVDLPTLTIFACGDDSLIRVFDAQQPLGENKYLGVLIPDQVVRSLLGILSTAITNSRWLVALTHAGVLLTAVSSPAYIKMDFLNERETTSLVDVVSHPEMDKFCFMDVTGDVTTVTLLSVIDGGHETLSRFPFSVSTGILSPDCDMVIVERDGSIYSLNLTNPNGQQTPTDLPTNSTIGSLLSENYFSIIVGGTEMAIVSIDTLEVVHSMRGDSVINTVDYEAYSDYLLVTYTSGVVASYPAPFRLGPFVTPVPTEGPFEYARTSEPAVDEGTLSPLVPVVVSSSWSPVAVVIVVVVAVVVVVVVLYFIIKRHIHTKPPPTTTPSHEMRDIIYENPSHSA